MKNGWINTEKNEIFYFLFYLILLILITHKINLHIPAIQQQALTIHDNLTPITADLYKIPFVPCFSDKTYFLSFGILDRYVQLQINNNAKIRNPSNENIDVI